MSYLRQLKAWLGLRPGSPERKDPDVTVEHEPSSHQSDAPVTEITGIGPARRETLATVGIETIEELAAADPQQLAAQTEISETRLRTWINTAQEDPPS